MSLPPAGLRRFWLAQDPRGVGLLGALQELCAGVARIEAASAGRLPADGIILDATGRASLRGDREIWRFETGSGNALLAPGGLDRPWYGPPGVMTVCLRRYAPGSAGRTLLAEAVIGTRKSSRALRRQLTRTMGLLLRRAAAGAPPHPATPPLADRAATPAGFLRFLAWRLWGLIRTALYTEHWGIGVIEQPIAAILGAGQAPAIRWGPEQGRSHFRADPFPWPGTDRVLCEEYSHTTERGRIVALREEASGHFLRERIIAEGPCHLSYPMTFALSGKTYLLPESGAQRRTTI